MTRFVKFAILTAICVICCFGCEKKEESFLDKKPQNPIEMPHSLPEVQQDAKTENKAPKETDPSIVGIGRALYVEEYKEDRAWVLCDANDDASWLIIDKAGNVLAGFPSIGMLRTSFDNGYAHVSSVEGNKVYTIDRAGNVVSYVESDPYAEQVVIAGGGYTITKDNISNFDTVGYQYTVYNADGSINGVFVTETDSEMALYIGKGVFFVNNGIYCAKVGKRIENICGSYRRTYNFNGEQVFITTAYDEEHENDCIMTVREDGVIKKAVSDQFSNNINVSDIAGDFCVILDLSYDKIFSFNVNTGDIYELDASYYERIPSWVWDNDPPTPNDERIVISLEGADGNSYSAIFDVYFNLIEGPVLGSFGSPRDGRIIASVYRDCMKDEVYDKNGKFVYSISDLNYSRKGTGYSCGAIAVCNEMNEYVYLDTNGNLLFKSLNFDNMKLVTLE